VWGGECARARARVCACACACACVCVACVRVPMRVRLCGTHARTSGACSSSGCSVRSASRRPAARVQCLAATGLALRAAGGLQQHAKRRPRPAPPTADAAGRQAPVATVFTFFQNEEVRGRRRAGRARRGPRGEAGWRGGGRCWPRAPTRGNCATTGARVRRPPRRARRHRPSPFFPSSKHPRNTPGPAAGGLFPHRRQPPREDVKVPAAARAAAALPAAAARARAARRRAQEGPRAGAARARRQGRRARRL
jgi:hypothetical protein